MADQKEATGPTPAEKSAPQWTRDGTAIECEVVKSHQTSGGGFSTAGERTYFVYTEDGAPLNLQLLQPIAPDDYPDVMEEALAWRKSQDEEVARAALLNRRREEILLGMK